MDTQLQTAPIVYRPLSHPREIRVIRLTANPDIALSLEHRNLDDNPSYVAVSYRWGTEAAEDDIIIDGRVLRVRQRLKSMIEALGDEYNGRFLWIDAICIHQNSNEEKNHQVRLMGDIYARVSHVLVYLEGAQQSTWGVSRQFVCSELAQWAHMYGVSPRVPSQHSRDRLLRETFLPVLSDEYFTRRWIMQEFCFARSLIFHFRGSTFSLQDLENLLQHNQQASFSRRVRSLCQLRNSLAYTQPTLEELLYDHESAVCSKYQGVIYALAPLTRQASLDLRVDYKLNRVELLVAVVQTCASYEGLPSLRTMSFVCFLRQQLGISRNDLCLAVQRQAFTIASDNTIFEACAVLRAELFSYRSDDSYEKQKLQILADSGAKYYAGSGHTREHLQILRQHCPSMQSYAAIPLKTISAETPDLACRDVQAMPAQNTHVVFSGTYHHQMYFGSAENNLVPFETWRIYSKSSSPWGFHFDGFSTCEIHYRDQAWQFPRTPLALILRPVVGGYTIVGRAQLLRTGFASSTNFDNVLDWITDDQNSLSEDCPRMTFMVTASQMLQLLHWVNLDQSL